MYVLGNLLILALSVYFWIIIASVVISWLVAFDVFNIRSPQAANLVRLLDRATDPVYRPLRRFIPPIGGIDITPMIVIFGISIAKHVVAMVFFQPAMMY